MRHLILVGVALLFTACSNLDPTPALEPRYLPSSGTVYEDNAVLKKAVVKLIRKYNDLNQRVVRLEKERKKPASKLAANYYFVEVDKANANLRARASMSATVVAKVNKGDMLELIDNSKGNWYRVKHKNKTAWIHSSMVKRRYKDA